MPQPEPEPKFIKSCYATELLDRGKTCVNYKNDCTCKLTGKIVNPKTCGQSFEIDRSKVLIEEIRNMPLGIHKMMKIKW